jgi:hypothetical protein
MWLMRFGLVGGYLVCFARFCALFRRSVRAALGGGRAGFLDGILHEVCR